MNFWSFGRRLVPLVLASLVQAAEPAAEAARTTPADPTAVNTTAAAAATELGRPAQEPDYLEQGVDLFLSAFDLQSSGNSVTHHAISLFLVGIALLARRIVTRLIFPALRRLASRTETTLDDKMFPALEGPAAALIVVLGLFSALRVLKLPAVADHYLGAGYQVALSLVVFWGLWRAFSALLSHLDEVARERSLGVAAFMPWIRKTLLTAFVVVAALLTFQSLGFDVKAVLAGLGIGGLALALAAKETLANLFGSIAVLMDRTFQVGDKIEQGDITGVVERIGMRSTRVRTDEGYLVSIPNQLITNAPVTNMGPQKSSL